MFSDAAGAANQRAVKFRVARGIIGTKLDGIPGYKYLRAVGVVIEYPNGVFRFE
jgi:hypothetical protein